MSLDIEHRAKSLPFQSIPPNARFWVLWPAPKGWEKDIQTAKDASLAADSWVAGHHLLDTHKCYVAESPPGTPKQILVVCETCPRPKP